MKGLIEPGAFCLIYGPPGSGKSFFTMDIAEAVATGGLWRGRKTQQGLVVYVAAEAGASILRRFIAWRDARLGEAHGAVPLAILTKGPNLLASLQVEDFIEQLIDLEIKAEKPLVMVVFDTLSRSMHGGDENKAEDMTMVVAVADRLREKFRAATIYVHHTGKEVTRGARGHSSLLGAADTALLVNDHKAVMEKVRDGISGDEFPFHLEPVTLGHDIDGEMVTTCLLTASDFSARKPRSQPTGKNQLLVYLPLKEMILDEAVSLPETSAIPAGTKGVSINELAERVLPKFGGMKEWRARQRITEALIGLQAVGFIGIWNDWVWLV